MMKGAGEKSGRLSGGGAGEGGEDPQTAQDISKAASAAPGTKSKGDEVKSVGKGSASGQDGKNLEITKEILKVKGAASGAKDSALESMGKGDKGRRVSEGGGSEEGGKDLLVTEDLTGKATTPEAKGKGKGRRVSGEAAGEKSSKDLQTTQELSEAEGDKGGRVSGAGSVEDVKDVHATREDIMAKGSTPEAKGKDKGRRSSGEGSGERTSKDLQTKQFTSVAAGTAREGKGKGGKGRRRVSEGGEVEGGKDLQTTEVSVVKGRTPEGKGKSRRASGEYAGEQGGKGLQSTEEISTETKGDTGRRVSGGKDLGAIPKVLKASETEEKDKGRREGADGQGGKDHQTTKQISKANITIQEADSNPTHDEEGGKGRRGSEVGGAAKQGDEVMEVAKNVSNAEGSAPETSGNDKGDTASGRDAGEQSGNDPQKHVPKRNGQDMRERIMTSFEERELAANMLLELERLSLAPIPIDPSLPLTGGGTGSRESCIGSRYWRNPDSSGAAGTSLGASVPPRVYFPEEFFFPNKGEAACPCRRAHFRLHFLERLSELPAMVAAADALRALRARAPPFSACLLAAPCTITDAALCAALDIAGAVCPCIYSDTGECQVSVRKCIARTGLCAFALAEWLVGVLKTASGRTSVTTTNGVEGAAGGAGEEAHRGDHLGSSSNPEECNGIFEISRTALQSLRLYFQSILKEDADKEEESNENDKNLKKEQ